MTRLARILAIMLLLLVASTPALGSGDPLRLGVITLSHPLMMYRQYLPFTDHVTEHSELTVELVLAKDYESIIRDLLDDEIDVALLGGLSYLEARRASADITPLCGVLSGDGTPTNRTVIFTRETGGSIATLKDLRGKRFAFASRHSTSGYLHPLCFLGKNGVERADFVKAENLRTHEAVVRAVLRGNYDAGAVSASTFMRFAGEGLKTLARTPSHPGFVFAARAPGIPRVERFRQFLLGMDYSSSELRSKAEGWSPLLRNGFVSVADSDYSKVRDLLQCAARYGYGG